MNTKYIAPETLIVCLNGHQLLQTEVFGPSKQGDWGDGANKAHFDDSEDFADEQIKHSSTLWDE